MTVSVKYRVTVYFSGRSHSVTFDEHETALEFGRRFRGTKPYKVEKITRIIEDACE